MLYPSSFHPQDLSFAAGGDLAIRLAGINDQTNHHALSMMVFHTKVAYTRMPR